MSRSPAPQPSQPSLILATQLYQRLQSLTTQIGRRTLALTGWVILLMLLIVTGILWLIRLQWWYVPLLVLLTVLSIIGIIAIIRTGGTGFKGHTKISTTTETTDPSSSPPKKISTTEEKQPQKTLWDWLQLLIIPLMLALIAIGFSIKQNNDSLTLNNNQYTQNLHIAATRYAQDQHLAQEQQVETNLQTYLDRMSQLLLDSNLHTQGELGDNVRILATARTLTILQDLDGPRRADVLKFLHGGGLISRQDPKHPEIVNPVVNLNGADFSGTDLSRFVLGGADLAFVNFTGATLDGADLSAAYLNQAILKGANLTGAKLDYAPLTGADLSCADPKTCTNLTNADLSGADLTNAKLTGVIFKNTDVTGTNPQDSFTQIVKGGKAFTTKWNVFQENNILQISHIEGGSLAAYGQLDLNTSKLQLNYGPLGNWGTSVVLLPALWSRTSCPNDYCETAPITSGSFSSLSRSELSQDTLHISVTGTIAGLTVNVDLSFSAPKNNSFSVSIMAHVSSTIPIELDQKTASGALLQSEAFKPILLRAIHDSSRQWSAQEAVFGSQPPFQLPENTRTAPTNVTTFGLIGGTSSSVTNAPTITVTLNDLKAAVTLEVKPSSDLNFDNVSVWAGVNSLPGEWSYTVVASMSSEGYTQVTSRSPVLYDPLNNNKAGNNWQENGHCSFAQGAYHVDGGEFAILTPAQLRSSPNDFYRGFYTTCIAQTANFSNFAYQIQMKFVKGGCAGIIFRVDTMGHYDIFNICDDGSYSYSVPEYFAVAPMDFFVGPSGTSSAIYKQLNQSNIITAIAIGQSISFFINQQYIMTVDDQSGSSQGQIGVIVHNPSEASTTEVAFNKARVWNL